MKALLMESNASREKSEKLQERDMPAQEKEIQDLQKQLKELYLQNKFICFMYVIFINVNYSRCFTLIIVCRLVCFVG